MPNADTESRQLSDQVKKYVSMREGTAKFFPSLGQLRYLSCLKHIDAVVGNSSSGLTEAPSFQIGTVNIGERQTGRLKADSVIDCAPIKQDILRALEGLFSEKFRSDLRKVQNPYGEGGAVEKIVHILNDCKPETLLKKKFQDLSFIHTTNRQ
jgi:GDP/UDP-N,N'-diacetylbacillosamine 2-epimerase (hydrolysing)